MTEDYGIKYVHACPESVHVEITRKRTKVKDFLVYREAAGSREASTMERVGDMMGRAEGQAERWVAEDREARGLEQQFNAVVYSGDSSCHGGCGQHR